MGRTILLALLAAASAVALLVVRAWRHRSVPVEQTGDLVPDSVQRRETLVDDASDGSFPASDPPSYWGRETAS